MVWWATWLATFCSSIFAVISFLQNQLTFSDSLDSVIQSAMNLLPKKWAPTYNYVSLRTRNDYLKVKDRKKYEKEKSEKV
uniref:ATP synthase F0 subunit 8 n=1 Tax=Panagrolaimus superbus TaxID=310955 RepID=A0A914XW59_9BILA